MYICKPNFIKFEQKEPQSNKSETKISETLK